MAAPEAAPGAAVARRPRPEPERVASARQRALVAARRALRRLPGLSPRGRAAGRIAATLPPLAPDATLDTPEVALLLSGSRADRVIAAAAAALLGHDLAIGIEPAARAEADAVVPAEARAFALAHRHLSRPATGLPVAARYARARTEVAHLWADRLPVPLDEEFRPDLPRPHAPRDPAPDPAAAGTAGRRLARRWRRPRRQIVLGQGGAAVPLPQARAAAAFDAALAALTDGQPAAPGIVPA